MSDRRCRFGLAARIEMVRRRQAGESLRQIARSMACSPTTVKTQCDRWRRADDASRAPPQTANTEGGGGGGADDASRADFSCLAPGRPVPKSCPWQLTAEQER